METYVPALFERNIVPPRPGIGEVIGAQLNYSYAPIIDTIANDLRYGNRRAPGYDPAKDAGDYIQYPEQVLRAVNPQHMAAIKSNIDKLIEARQVMSNATVGQHLVAGVVDPINLVALPFGGPVAGIGRSALRTGAGVGAIQAGLEAAALPFDPLRTYQESALNIATASLFGAGFGAALGAPLTMRARAWSRTQEELKANFDNIRRIEEVSNLSRDEVLSMAPRADRPLGSLSDEELRLTIARIDSDIENVSRSIDPDMASRYNDDFARRAYELTDEAIPYRKELGYRALELEVVDLKDPYNIAPSWFTDSLLFKAVTTPMKRALQGKAPSVVKEKFVKLASDAGMALNLNRLGLATPQSVHQRAAVSQGRWVAAHDEMLKLWSSDTNAPNATVLDINLGDLARRAQRSPDTYGEWLKQINEKRIQNDTNLTENQIKAVEVINRYFKDAERRLEDVGLIGSERGIKNQIARLQEEIDSLKTQQFALEDRKDGRSIRERVMIEGRLITLEKRLEERQDEAAALQDFAVNPEREDVFFPRFWDHSVIRSNRNEFADVLFKWYQQNPTITRYDPEAGKFVRVQLETSERAIRERVDQTIAAILGEKDPTNVDNIGFGYGRSKHFRHRQVDIPNKLVMKFIVTDPLAVMKTYATRIEPRYEYARMFGKDHDGVVFDMRREMLRAGKSEAEIAKTVRDYNHLYDRIAGAVIRNPDSLDQRAAFALREAASFTYMGSAGFAALPDFGRIVMEYELENVVKGLQTLVDKNSVKMSVDEVRLAGEALDILRGTAHLRLVEGMANDINANEVLTKARNAFYILNGLSPMTTLAKQLAGVIDAHTIIDYSIKLSKGQLDEKGRVWLSRYGISEDTARNIARAPWQKNDKGLYMGNTDEWTSDEAIETFLKETFTYNYPTMPFSKMSQEELTAHFKQEFPDVTFYTDPKIVGSYFEKLKTRGFPKLMAFMTDMRDLPDGGFSVHIDKDMVQKSFDAMKRDARSADEIKANAQKALEDNVITEEYFYHLMNQVDAADIFKSADDYLEYVILHELHHSAINRKAGESVASWEDRIDKAAISYMRDQRSSGERRAKAQQKAALLREREETVESFRVALNSGVLNTIMSGTPADKPIITDGVVYIPSRIGKLYGFDEDPRNPGYSRIENGFLGLPFQFYAFALANVNKTVGALAQGTVKNRMIGVTTMLGLAYMTMKIRTPEAVWDQMDWQDKFARTYDMSGVTALYSDLFYTAMHTSLALGGPNITGGLLSPKFPQQPSMADAITGFAGAGPSWSVDMARGIYQFAGGDYGEGAREIVRNLPFARMWFWKDEMNQLTRAWAQ